MKKLLRAGLCVSLMLGLSSCSKLSWALRFADIYVMNELDNYFDLSRGQSREIKPQVQKIIADSRREDLPRLAEILERAETSLRNGGTVDENSIAVWTAEIQAFAFQALRRIEPVALRLAETASAEQEQNFATEFERRTRKMKDEVSTKDKARRKDLERSRRSVEFFVTDLSRSQMKKIEAFVEKHPSNFAAQIRNREDLMAAFMASPAEERKAWIRRFLEDPNFFRTPESLAISRERQENLARLMTEIWKDLSPTQRENALRNLKEKAADFRRLSQI